MTTPEAWTTFLRQYKAQIEPIDTPGASPVTHQQLEATEQRLGIQLPPSYRAFLQTSNGWSNASRFIPVLQPIESINWFRKDHREWINAYKFSEPLDDPETDYFNYANCDPVQFDPKHLQHTLCVSEVGDDTVILLNPMVVWPDGEWETWFFANWLPGALRFRSFADWFKYARAETDLEAAFTHDQKPDELPTVYLDPPSKPQRRIRPRQKIHDFKSVLKGLKSSNPITRRTAAKRMGRIRTPDSFNALTDVIKTEQDHYVRMEIILSIGRIGSDAALDFLVPYLDDEELSPEAAKAIADMSLERATEISLNLLATNHEEAPPVAYILATKKEMRAIPLLVKLATGAQTVSGRSRVPLWTSTLAQFGNTAAFNALLPLADHRNKLIRESVHQAMALLVFAGLPEVKSKARHVLEHCLQTETDPQLRAAIQTSLDILPASGGLKRSTIEPSPFT